MWLGIFQTIWFILFMLFDFFILLIAVVCIPLIMCGVYGARNCRRWYVVPFIVNEFIYMGAAVVLCVFSPAPFIIAITILWIL
jgi:hypothetical protein